MNLGVRRGLSELLKQDLPWLVSMHCMNHHFELAAKDAFSSSYLNKVCTMLLNLYLVYEKSPKRLQELHSLADIIKGNVTKPDRASGTRWAQHRYRALKSLKPGSKYDDSGTYRLVSFVIVVSSYCELLKMTIQCVTIE